jgi:hypothetical protein
VQEVHPEGGNPRDPVIREHVERPGEDVVEAPGHHVPRLEAVGGNVHARNGAEVVRRGGGWAEADLLLVHHRHGGRRFHRLFLHPPHRGHDGVQEEGPGPEGDGEGLGLPGGEAHRIHPLGFISEGGDHHGVGPRRDPEGELPLGVGHGPGAGRAQELHRGTPDGCAGLGIGDPTGDGAHLLGVQGKDGYEEEGQEGQGPGEPRDSGHGREEVGGSMEVPPGAPLPGAWIRQPGRTSSALLIVHRIILRLSRKRAIGTGGTPGTRRSAGSPAGGVPQSGAIRWKTSSFSRVSAAWRTHSLRNRRRGRSFRS